MSKKAIVTGASGWLGSRLIELLANGHPEVAELRQPSDRAIVALLAPETDVPDGLAFGNNVTFVKGDIADPETLGRLTKDAAEGVFFHTAGVIHPGRHSDFARVNTEGTRAALEAASRAGIKRFVYVSSNSPFGCNKRSTDTFDEAAEYNPYMGYGASKMQAELLVKRESRMETVIVRPPWFYGPNQPPRQTLFFRMIKEGRMPIVGSGENRRSMGYVDNVCQGLMLAARSPAASGKAYWIADRRPYTMNEIVSTVQDVLRTDFGIDASTKQPRVPGFVSDVAELVDSGLQAVGLYHQKIHVLSEMNKTIACSIDLAERELGYSPTVELREGMRRSVQWLLDRGVTI